MDLKKTYRGRSARKAHLRTMRDAKYFFLVPRSWLPTDWDVLHYQSMIGYAIISAIFLASLCTTIFAVDYLALQYAKPSFGSVSMLQERQQLHKLAHKDKSAAAWQYVFTHVDLHSNMMV